MPFARIPLLLIAAIFLGFSPAPAMTQLTIINDTTSDILNILARPQNEGREAEFFLRLDLAPHGSDQMEIPASNVDLRVDTGLEFWFFDRVDLSRALRMIFCGDHRVCLRIDENGGATEHLAGKIVNLAPQPGDRPVCELTRFHPSMGMKDVCAILDPDLPRDDNGSLLTGLGFAGMLWAGRLIPENSGPINDYSTLEHLELRRQLSPGDVQKILQTLFAQGYVPWQAEFPEQNMDFAEMPESAEARDKLLYGAIEKFLSAPASTPDPNRTDTEKEARIMLAPRNMLASLAEADAPTRDVQLFTVILKPASGTLLVDVAAYRGTAEKAR